VWTEGACERILVTGNIATDCARKMPADTLIIDLRAATESIENGNIVATKK
jgi:hypothetical protein